MGGRSADMSLKLEQIPYEFEGKTYMLRCNMAVLEDIQEAHGGWIDGDTEYQEYTLVIYLSDTTEDAVHSAADELIEVFHQSSVLIQTNPTTTEFYG